MNEIDDQLILSEEESPVIQLPSEDDDNDTFQDDLDVYERSKKLKYDSMNRIRTLLM